MKRLLLTSALAMIAQGASADEIRVLNWQGYGTDLDWAVAAFAEKTGNTVVHEYFTSEQEMLTKLRTNPGAYDVVLINSAYTAQAQAEGLIDPIDTAKITHFADLDPGLTGNEDLNPAGALHGVPWTWGLTSIAVNTGDFAELPTSLSVLWDPALKGRVSIRDDGLEAVQFAAMATGQNINAITDMEAVKAKLTELMPQITTFWSSENDWNQFMSAGDFAVATYWSGSAARSQAAGLPVAFVVPDEGAIGWLDDIDALFPQLQDHSLRASWKTQLRAPLRQIFSGAAFEPILLDTDLESFEASTSAVSPGFRHAVQWSAGTLITSADDHGFRATGTDTYGVVEPTFVVADALSGKGTEPAASTFLAAATRVDRGQVIAMAGENDR